jgi:hypothetical protein
VKARFITDLSTVTFARLDLVKIAAYVNGLPPTDPVEEGDDRLWILGQPLRVELSDPRNALEMLELAARDPVIVVQPGFVTDGASVPRFAQLLTGWHPWDEPHRWGAIVHDWLYCMNGAVRDETVVGRWRIAEASKYYADQAFRATLTAAGCTRLRSTVMYWAVRLFGGPAYRSDQATGPTIRP